MVSMRQGYHVLSIVSILIGRFVSYSHLRDACVPGTVFFSLLIAILQETLECHRASDLTLPQKLSSTKTNFTESIYK